MLYFNTYAACANFPDSNILGFGYASRQGAKTPSSENIFLPLRLGAFAGDIPNSFFALFAPFAVNYPIPNLFFGCGSAALGFRAHANRTSVMGLRSSLIFAFLNGGDNFSHDFLQPFITYGTDKSQISGLAPYINEQLILRFL